MSDTTADTARPPHFIRQIIERDLSEGKNSGAIVTRFPPEPNGYLHIGHAKSICLNFGIAADYGGQCNLRFDDTNPTKEDDLFVKAIKEDVRWLGFDWGERLFHASDYFEQLYEWAVELIQNGKAYVCELTADEIRSSRGTLTTPGVDSPYRNRPVEENLALFSRMRDGEFPEGSCVLRAKIDMASPNMNMRDPTLYRIRHQTHQNTGDRWRIYPMYDYTHPLSDAIEGVTHSLCTLEFEDHRPLYDWVLDNVSAPCHPQQIEFSRLELDYTVMSKRLLTTLVSEGLVNGWDDPRMPTISGMRRRGYTPGAIRDFSDRVGVTKKNQRIEMKLLENCVREDLEATAPRAMAVVDPVRLVIENYEEAVDEYFDAPNHPGDASMGTRSVPFCRELYVERSDIMEDPPKKFYRLAPGREVRLRYAYYVTCREVIKDADGEIAEVRCIFDPDSRGGGTPDGRKVRGTIHWVSARHGIQAELRLYDRLFNVPDPLATRSDDFHQHLNPDSLRIFQQSVIEPSLARASFDDRFQFERTGYFCLDPDTAPERLVFNQTVPLRDSWAKKKGQ